MQRIVAAFGVASLFIALSSSAENTFQGRVLTKGTRVPLKSVNITILPHKIRVQTDEQGNFKTEAIPEGPFQWIVNVTNFERFEQADVSTSEGTGPASRTFYVLPKQTFVYETVVTAKESNDDSRRTLNVKKAMALPGAAQDPVRAVQNLPGINRPQGFSSQVIIQGSAPQDTRYQIDGHEVPIIFHFGGLSSVVTPELLESVDLYTAGYQSNLGRAMGGVIDLQTQTPDKERWKGMAFVDIFNVGAAAEGPIDDESSLSFGGRYSYIGPVLGAVAKASDSFNLTVAPTFSDLTAIYARNLSNNARFKVVATGSRDVLEFVTNSGFGNDPLLRGKFYNETAFFRLIPQVIWEHSKVSESRFSLGLGRDWIRFEVGDQYFSLKNYSLTARGQHKRELIPEIWSSTFGFDNRYNYADVGIVLPVVFSSGGVANPLSTGEPRRAELQGVRNHSVGIYWNNEVRLGKQSRWTIWPGLRFDRYTAIKKNTLLPRLSAKYQLRNDLFLKAGSGIYSQAPQEGQVSSTFGNPNLNPQQSIHATFGAEKDLSESLGTGSNLYSGVFSRWFDQLVIPNQSTIYSNDGKGRAYGWETLFKWDYNPWFSWLSYTLSRSTRWDPSKPEYLYNNDQTHIATAIVGYQLPRRWKISSRFRFVSGVLITPVLGGTYDSDNDVYLPIRGATFSERQSPFMMLDLRIDKEWVFDTWKMSFYVDIQNVLNRANVEGQQYSFDYSQRQDVAGLPILPTIGLKGEF